jgi:hypothetical protein
LQSREETRIGSCKINGASHHITAIPVDGFGRVQAPRDPADNHRYDALCAFESVGPGFETVSLDGQCYVLVLTPFCQ